MRLLVFLLLSFSASLALGLATNAKVYPFSPNQTLHVTLSATNVNRVSISHDAITYALCPQRFCRVVANQQDPSAGVYVSLLQPMPFTLQLASRSGQHVALQVMPKQGDGRTLVLKGRVPTNAAAFPKNANYTNELSTLVRAILNQQSLAGFTQVAVKGHWQPFYQVGRVRLITVWQGETFTGLAYWLVNQTKHTITLNPSDFYRPNVASVALARQTVPAHQGTWVAVVKLKEGAGDE